jgi:SH3 domain protein
MGYSAIILFAVLLITGNAQAAFVSDRLFLGIYPLPDATTTPLKMLPSGSEVKVLEEQADFVRIKTADGDEGWVRAEFIGNRAPASVTIKQVTAQRDQLQAQLNAMSVTEQTVSRLQRQLAEANETIKGLRREMQGEQVAAAEQTAQLEASQQDQITELQQKLVTTEGQVASLQAETKTLKDKIRAAGGNTEDTLVEIAWVLISMLLCLIIGAVLGANWLAQRVRKRFNGRKVW